MQIALSLRPAARAAAGVPAAGAISGCWYGGVAGIDGTEGDAGVHRGEPLVPFPEYGEERARAPAAIVWDDLDAPVVAVVRAFNELPHAFTLHAATGTS
jgi:hypothetical protein